MYIPFFSARRAESLSVCMWVYEMRVMYTSPLSYRVVYSLGRVSLFAAAMSFLFSLLDREDDDKLTSH